MNSAVKIHFRLVQDEDDYPPANVESLWAQPITTNSEEYVIDNVPFFTHEATIGDTVLVSEVDGQKWFKSVARPSQNSLIRVVLFMHALVDRVSEQLIELGCVLEYSSAHNLLAVNVPPAANLSKVQKYLQEEVDVGAIDYEEALLRH